MASRVSTADRFGSNAIPQGGRSRPCTTPEAQPVQAEFLETQGSVLVKSHRGLQRRARLAVALETRLCGILMSVGTFQRKNQRNRDRANLTQASGYPNERPKRRKELRA